MSIDIRAEIAEAKERGLTWDGTEWVSCDHQCSSNCRREGCNCGCGEYHLSYDENDFHESDKALVKQSKVIIK